MRNGEGEEGKEEEEVGWDAGVHSGKWRPATWWRPEIDGFVFFYFFFFFFLSQNLIPAEIYISAEIDRNSTEWLECPETDWDLNRGGTGGITVPD